MLVGLHEDAVEGLKRGAKRSPDRARRIDEQGFDVVNQIMANVLAKKGIDKADPSFKRYQRLIRNLNKTLPASWKKHANVMRPKATSAKPAHPNTQQKNSGEVAKSD